MRFQRFTLLPQETERENKQQRTTDYPVSSIFITIFYFYTTEKFVLLCLGMDEPTRKIKERRVLKHTKWSIYKFNYMKWQITEACSDDDLSWSCRLFAKNYSADMTNYLLPKQNHTLLFCANILYNLDIYTFLMQIYFVQITLFTKRFDYLHYLQTCTQVYNHSVPHFTCACIAESSEQTYFSYKRITNLVFVEKKS